MILNVTINYSDATNSSVDACDSYTWEGQTLTSSGILTHTYTNSEGCDSIHTLNVTINYSDATSSSVVSCDSYTWEGQTVTSSGALTHTYTNAAGCDSILTINVTINTSAGFTDFETSQINAFPNPSSGIIKIQGIEKLGVIYGINIQNSEGRILKKISTDYSKINISDLRSGIYFLSILYENGEGNIRIIKK